MNFGSLFKGFTNFQFPYSLDQEPFYETPIWELYHGSRKKDSYPVTIFKAKNGLDDQVVEILKHSVHMCKVLRVPGIIPILDVFDQNGLDSLFIVTELVRPLQESIDQGKNNFESCLLGFYDIFQLFHIVEPLFVIGNICKENIFTDKRGKWVYFGLECCFDKKKMDKFQMQNNIEIWNRVHTSIDTIEIPNDNLNQIDSCQLSKLLTQLLNSNFDNVKVPIMWKRNLQLLLQGKLTINKFIDIIKQTTTWQNSQLLSIYEEMQELHIKDDKDRLLIMNKFQKNYLECADRDFYQHLTLGFINQLILPEIATTINWIMSNGVNLNKYSKSLIKLLTVFLDLIINDPHDDNLIPDWKEIIYNSFKLTDRQIRFILLLYLPKFIAKYPKNTLDISNRIFNFYLQGMTDTDSTLRLTTLKTVPIIVTQITERQLNNEILRSIAKTQVDSDIDIRMWTVLIIVKISHNLSGLTNRDSILATIYTKSLKDPSIKTKLAALYGLTQSIDMFTVEIIANKILTVIAPGLLDKDKIIRKKARELFNLYLKKLEDEASDKFQDSNNDDDNDNDEANENTRLMDEFDLYQNEDTVEKMNLRIVEMIHGLSLQENDYIELENVDINQHMGELSGRTQEETHHDDVEDDPWFSEEGNDNDTADDAWSVDPPQPMVNKPRSSILSGTHRAKPLKLSVGRQTRGGSLGRRSLQARQPPARQPGENSGKSTLAPAAPTATAPASATPDRTPQKSPVGVQKEPSLDSAEEEDDGGWDEVW